MWPVVFCAVAVIVTVVWRLLDLSVQLGRSRALLERVDDLIGRGMIAEALAAARGDANPAARVLGAGLARRADGHRRTAQAFRTAEAREVARLERGFIVLAASATIAPLAGALASVLALLKNADAAWVESVLAPFAGGVVVAVAASVVHLWLAARVDRFVAELRRTTDASTRVIESFASSR